MFPNIIALTASLREIKRNGLCGEDEMDVRLQVTHEGWDLHTGSPQYDTNHRGWWGYGTLYSGRQNIRELAREMLQDAKDSYYEWAAEDRASW